MFRSFRDVRYPTRVKHRCKKENHSVNHTIRPQSFVKKKRTRSVVMLTFDIYKKKKKIREVELIIRVIVSFSETRYS